jgi:hypothetical protein
MCTTAEDRVEICPSAVGTRMLGGEASLCFSASGERNVSPFPGAKRKARPSRSCLTTNRTQRWQKPQSPSKNKHSVAIPRWSRRVSLDLSVWPDLSRLSIPSM